MEDIEGKSLGIRDKTKSSTMDQLRHIISKVAKIFTQVLIAITAARFLYAITVEEKRSFCEC